MSIVKKITISLLAIAVCIGCLCIPASAQWITADKPLTDYSSSNRLLLPYRITARYKVNENQYWGSVTNISPAYAVPLPNPNNESSVQQSLTYTQATISSSSLNTTFQNAFKQLNQRTANLFDDGIVYEYVNQYWFGTSHLFGADYLLYQYDFPAFYYKPNLGGTLWYSFDDTLSGVSPVKSSGCTIIYAVYEDNEIKLHTDTFAIASEGYLSTQIFDKLTKTPYTTSEGQYYIASLSLGVENTRGYLQFRQSPSNVRNVVRVASPDTLIANYSVDYDEFNILEWLGDAIDGFLGTSLFQVGDVKVTLGVALTLPLAVYFLIAFLRKFAGG